MLPKNQEAHDFDHTIHRILDLSIDLLTRLLIRLLALPLVFWLGLAADHSSHKPTAHPGRANYTAASISLPRQTTGPGCPENMSARQSKYHLP